MGDNRSLTKGGGCGLKISTQRFWVVGVNLFYHSSERRSVPGPKYVNINPCFDIRVFTFNSVKIEKYPTGSEPSISGSVGQYFSRKTKGPVSPFCRATDTPILDFL